MTEETLNKQQLEGPIPAETMKKIFELAENRLKSPEAITLLGDESNLRYPQKYYEGERDLQPIRPQTEEIVISFENTDIAVARSIGRRANTNSMHDDYQ